MALKSYKPTSPARRGLVLVDRSSLYKGKPVKALTVGKIGTGARNNLGRITVRFRGGGHKRALRLVDFKRLAGVGTRLFGRQLGHGFDRRFRGRSERIGEIIINR